MVHFSEYPVYPTSMFSLFMPMKPDEVMSDNEMC
jgi:hypothetical protein